MPGGAEYGRRRDTTDEVMDLFWKVDRVRGRRPGKDNWGH